MDFDDIFKTDRAPVPIVNFRLGVSSNLQVPGGRDGVFWELPSDTDIDQTSFLRLGQPWLGFFIKGDLLQIEPGERLPEGFFDVAALRLPSGRVWVGYTHILPGNQLLLRAGQTLAGTVTYGVNQIEVLGQAIRCFRGVTTSVGKRQKHRIS